MKSKSIDFSEYKSQQYNTFLIFKSLSVLNKVKNKLQRKSQSNIKNHNINKIDTDNNNKSISETIIKSSKDQPNNKTKKVKSVLVNKNKRKTKPYFLEKNNKLRTALHISKNIKKVEEALGGINSKSIIHFDDSGVNSNIVNNNNNGNILEEEKIDKIDDYLEELKRLDEEEKIKNFNKNNNNEDFIKRIKNNNNFIKKKNIIINDDEDINDNNKKQSKLKLYKFKGHHPKK